jgi:hypothetical protein
LRIGIVLRGDIVTAPQAQVQIGELAQAGKQPAKFQMGSL